MPSLPRGEEKSCEILHSVDTYFSETFPLIAIAIRSISLPECNLLLEHIAFLYWRITISRAMHPGQIQNQMRFRAGHYAAFIIFQMQRGRNYCPIRARPWQQQSAPNSYRPSPSAAPRGILLPNNTNYRMEGPFYYATRVHASEITPSECRDQISYQASRGFAREAWYIDENEWNLNFRLSVNGHSAEQLCGGDVYADFLLNRQMKGSLRCRFGQTIFPW